MCLGKAKVGIWKMDNVLRGVVYGQGCAKICPSTRVTTIKQGGVSKNNESRS